MVVTKNPQSTLEWDIMILKNHHLRNSHIKDIPGILKPMIVDLNKEVEWSINSRKKKKNNRKNSKKKPYLNQMLIKRKKKQNKLKNQSNKLLCWKFQNQVNKDKLLSRLNLRLIIILLQMVKIIKLLNLPRVSSILMSQFLFLKSNKRQLQFKIFLNPNNNNNKIGIGVLELLNKLRIRPNKFNNLNNNNGSSNNINNKIRLKFWIQLTLNQVLNWINKLRSFNRISSNNLNKMEVVIYFWLVKALDNLTNRLKPSNKINNNNNNNKILLDNF